MKDISLQDELTKLQALNPKPSSVATKQKPKRKKTYRSLKTKEKLKRKALILTKQGQGLSKIALSLNVPKSTLRALLSDNELYTLYRTKQKQVLDAKFAKVALKSIKHAEKQLKDATYLQAMTGAAIAHDKTYPQQTIGVNVDNRTMNVKFSKWHNAPFKPRGRNK